MARVMILMVSIFSLLSVSWAAEPSNIKTQTDKDSYSVGYTFGKNMKTNGAELDLDVLLQGIRDGFQQKPSALGQDEIRNSMSKLEERLTLSRKERARNAAATNQEEGKAFLTANKDREGVKTLASGLQYKVLVEGNGPTPKETDSVTVNYRGTLIDGSLFDSSYTREKPETVQVNKVIKGWAEALQLMKTGSKWQIFVPPDLAYGAKGFNKIPPNSTLVFDVELLSISGKSKPEKGGDFSVEKSTTD